eukprot:COSAG01_NODE_1357_length_10597_cov_2.476948_5_plen_245_part_00
MKTEARQCAHRRPPAAGPTSRPAVYVSRLVSPPRTRRGGDLTKRERSGGVLAGAASHGSAARPSALRSPRLTFLLRVRLCAGRAPVSRKGFIPYLRFIDCANGASHRSQIDRKPISKQKREQKTERGRSVFSREFQIGKGKGSCWGARIGTVILQKFRNFTLSTTRTFSQLGKLMAASRALMPARLMSKDCFALLTAKNKHEWDNLVAISPAALAEIGFWCSNLLKWNAASRALFSSSQVIDVR